jgi:hypothetical protein
MATTAKEHKRSLSGSVRQAELEQLGLSRWTTPAEFVRRHEGTRVIESILIANNGIAVSRHVLSPPRALPHTHTGYRLSNVSAPSASGHTSSLATSAPSRSVFTTRENSRARLSPVQCMRSPPAPPFLSHCAGWLARCCVLLTLVVSLW